MSVKLFLVPQEYVSDFWQLAEPHIERAVSYADGLVTVEDHKQCVLRGARQLWLICEEGSGGACLAAGVTEIVNGVCLIWALGGSQMKRWWHTQEILEAYAKAHGCRGLHIYGRRAWARALRARGYKERCVVLHKEFAP